ncbi:MAG TPA: hypothetical protein VN947_03880 [Polyangia bacterium]|nr:hypothetical protein [Polyangia bacterium]
MKRLVLATAIAAIGCGSGSGSHPDGGDGGMMQESCSPDGKQVAVTGRYAVRGDLLVNVKVVAGCSGAACIVDNDANAELLFVADLTQTGTSVAATVTPCKIVIPPVALKNQPMPVQLTVPDALIASVLPVMSTATLGGSDTCATFQAQPITITLGASLANVASDPLPTFSSSATPPVVECGGMATTACASTANPVGPTDKGCACDQEGDAKVGATVTAKNAPGFEDIDQLYIDLRTSVTLSGQVYPGQQIKGKVEGLRLDQNVLGCHRSNAPGVRDCMDAETNTVAGFNPAVTQSVNGDSTFVAVPVGAGTTCDQVKAMEGTLFP